jgi:hypothetical protein
MSDVTPVDIYIILYWISGMCLSYYRFKLIKSGKIKKLEYLKKQLEQIEFQLGDAGTILFVTIHGLFSIPEAIFGLSKQIFKKINN